MASVEREEWSDGPALDSPALAERVLTLWREAAEISGDDSTAAEPPRDVASAQAMIDESGGWLVDVMDDTTSRPGRVIAAAARLMLEHARLHAEIRDVAASRRLRGFAHVSTALGRLRRVGTVDEMLRRVPDELLRCGFDRAMVTRVDGSVGTPVAVRFAGDSDWAAEVMRAGAGKPLQITHLLLESEMLRRRGPGLVRDARTDPRVHGAFAELTRTRSYVAAPIMPQGNVVGLLHADCYNQSRAVDEVDRDLLWMFAEGLGHAYERAVLLTRLRSLRQEVRRANSSILAVMDEFCDADVEVARMESGDQGVARSAAAMFVTAESRLESLLTPRELDVIRLMAVGDTNAGIASKLVVSEGTVKSHVKHILRKLRASNRAEAVSRYIRLEHQSG